jgi:hypothetical protein
MRLPIVAGRAFAAGCLGTWRNAGIGAQGTMRIFCTTREADGIMCRRFE